jgi:hypothetical protein
MRKVDKKAFLNTFDKGTLLGYKIKKKKDLKLFKEKTFAHVGQVRGDELEKEQ